MEKVIIDATSDHESADQEGSCHLKYSQILTPESILGEIWYRSQGLHLLGARIRCTHLNFQDLTTNQFLRRFGTGVRGYT
jgi:hypothetical protein